MGGDVSGMGGSPGACGVWVQSPALLLLHEIAHAVQATLNPDQYADDQAYTPDYDTKENRRVITGIETTAARDLGEATRKQHDAQRVRTQGPTSRAKRDWKGHTRPSIHHGGPSYSGARMRTLVDGVDTGGV